LSNSELQILLFSTDNEKAEILENKISSQSVRIQVLPQLSFLSSFIEESSYDLFLCQSEKIDVQISQICHKLRETFPAIFITLVTKQLEVPQSLSVDYILPESNFNKETELSVHLDNICKFARLIKNQAELSQMLLHDLRSPAQSIIGYIELLEQQVFGEVNEGQRQIMLSALALGDSIIELMDELGQVYQFEKNDFEFLKSRIDAKQLLDETLRSLWVQADRKNIKFIPKIANDLPSIEVDYMAIQRVLNNLIHNAIKFSPENGDVLIEVNKVDNKSIHFQVTDSGPGIPPDQIAHVFDKYFRIIDYKHKQKGQGLGLYICKLIIDAHGGEIGIENGAEKGSIFSFTLPV